MKKTYSATKIAYMGSAITLFVQLAVSILQHISRFKRPTPTEDVHIMNSLVKTFRFIVCIGFILFCSCISSGNIAAQKEGLSGNYCDLEPAELELLHKMLIENVKVVDNRMVTELTKSDFVELGLPEKYYDQLIIDLKNNNDFFESKGIKNVEEMFNEAKKELLKEINRNK